MQTTTAVILEIPFVKKTSTIKEIVVQETKLDKHLENVPFST